MSDAVDSALFLEVRTDIRKLTEQMSRMNANFDHWSPIWNQQMNGLADLANRQTKHEMEVSSLRNYMVDGLVAVEKRMNEEKAILERRLDDEKAASTKLDEALAKAEEQRTLTLRWIIGMGFTGAGIMIALLTFLIGHVSLR